MPKPGKNPYVARQELSGFDGLLWMEGDYLRAVYDYEACSVTIWLTDDSATRPSLTLTGSTAVEFVRGFGDVRHRQFQTGAT